MSGWIGVDLDGTLAVFKNTEVWDGSIGDPVPDMVARVKVWLAAGRDVRIFTARVGNYSFSDARRNDPRSVHYQIKLIEEWCQKHLGNVLPITAQKDYGMVEMWDDRAVRVEMNTGRVLSVQ